MSEDVFGRNPKLSTKFLFMSFLVLQTSSYLLNFFPFFQCSEECLHSCCVNMSVSWKTQFLSNSRDLKHLITHKYLYDPTCVGLPSIFMFPGTK
jgi:hypothetical protein